MKLFRKRNDIPNFIETETPLKLFLCIASCILIPLSSYGIYYSTNNIFLGFLPIYLVGIAFSIGIYFFKNELSIRHAVIVHLTWPLLVLLYLVYLTYKLVIMIILLTFATIFNENDEFYDENYKHLTDKDKFIEYFKNLSNWMMTNELDTFNKVCVISLVSMFWGGILGFILGVILT